MSSKTIPIQRFIEDYIVAPCLGCGYCCKKAICMVGQDQFRLEPTARCSGLRHDGERYRCELADTFREELYIGEGCPCSLNSDRSKLKKRIMEKQFSVARVKEV